MQFNIAFQAQNMRMKTEFEESKQSFDSAFGEVINLSEEQKEAAYQNGYTEGHMEGQEAGYQAGHKDGLAKGYDAGHAAGYDAGLAARTYETWTITLTDGTVIEKEVALL